jgi:PAS domain S-box-containing protein
MAVGFNMDSIHLMLVEDDKEQAILVKHALSRNDRCFEVTVVESGEACLSALAEADCDLILLDYRLPHANGLDVLREMRRAGHQVPVIMMTAHGDEAVAVEAMKAGAADYIVKQAGYLAQLGPTARQVLRRHQLETELAASQQRYRLLFESSRDAILILNSETQIIDLNPRVETLLGAPRDELIGQSILDLVQPDQPEQSVLWYQQLRSQGMVSNISFSFVNRQERRRRIEMDAIWLEQGYYQLFMRDITQTRREQAVWDALNRAALAAHNQLESEEIYRAVANILLELGLFSSMWWLDEEKEALQVRYTTYTQDLQDQFAERTGLDVEDLWVSLDRLTVFRDQVMKGEIVYLTDGAELVRQLVSADEPELVDWVLERFCAAATVLLPFAISGKVAGMLLIHGDLSEQNVAAARAFAAQISSALDQARLYGDAQRRITELAALQEISFKLSSALEMRPLLEAITDVALKVTDAYNCHIYLVGEEGFDFIAARRRDGGSEPIVKQPRPDGLVARVAREAVPQLIDDAKHHPLYQAPEARRWGIEAIAGYPLLRGGQVLGVFTLTYLVPHRFGQAERHILNLLADQSAAAVETARLYEDLRRRNEDLSTLRQVALAVSAQINISDVLEVAYKAVSRATGARTFAVGLYDETTDDLVYEMIREEGEVASHQSLPVTGDQGLTPWVARNRQELIIGDLQSDRLPVPDITIGEPVRSWMGFPLIAGERLVGVMAVQSRQPNAFDAGHQRLCRGIATQVAIALEKAQLLEETRQRNWELSVLNKVSATVSHSFDLETLLDEALSIVLDEMQLDAGAFHLLDEKKGALTLVSQKSLPPEAVREVLAIAPGEGFSGRVILNGEPIVVDNYQQDPRRLSQHASDYNCFAAAPLSSKDHTIGTLSVLDSKPRRLTASEVDLLVAIGRQIGVAVENVVLYRQTRDRERRLRRLHEAARSLSSVLESRTVLQRVLETAVGELQASGVLLWLHDDKAGLYPHLALGTFSGQQSKPDPAARAEMEQVLREKKGVLWGDRENPQRMVGTEVTGKRGYRAAVPLRGQAGEMGVLEVATAGERDLLTGDDVDFMSTLGGIAAIAHENAQLYEALTRYAVSLEAKVDKRTAEFRREKEQTEAILRSVADGVFVVDRRSEIVLTNPAAERLLNIPEQSDDLCEYLRTVAQQPDSAAPGPTITLGEQTLQARAAKIRQEGTELGTVIVLRDVTHFEQVNRLKSEFVSTASHELRTPLSNLKLYLSLLERGGEEKRSDYQRVLAQEVNRLENLILDLLDLSRLESRERPVVKERLNLRDVVSHVLTILAPQAKARQITLVSDCEADEVNLWVEASRDQMVQMVINLTANAINYTEPQGRVTLKLGEQTDERGLWVTFAVQDTGVGIAPSDLSRIWDRFFRGQVQRHMSPGTGLGLAIVTEILDRHGGWITVESEEGVGSLFTVGLPVVVRPDHDVDET